MNQDLTLFISRKKHDPICYKPKLNQKEIGIGSAILNDIRMTTEKILPYHCKIVQKAAGKVGLEFSSVI